MVVPVKSVGMAHPTTESNQKKVAAALTAAGIVDDLGQETPDFTTNSQVVMDRRYLSKDREGQVLEGPEGMFRRVAQNLSQADLNYGATEEQRQATEV